MNTHLLFVFFILCVSSTVIFTQNKALERISGKITGASTGEPMPGVNIQVEMTWAPISAAYCIMAGGATIGRPVRRILA